MGASGQGLETHQPDTYLRPRPIIMPTIMHSPPIQTGIFGFCHETRLLIHHHFLCPLPAKFAEGGGNHPRLFSG